MQPGLRLRICVLLLMTAVIGMLHSAERKLIGRWECIALDRSHLALSGDFSNLERLSYEPLYQKRMSNYLTSWRQWAVEAKHNISISEAILSSRPQIVKKLQSLEGYSLSSENGPSCSVSSLGYWLNAAGLSRCKDKFNKTPDTLNADVVHYAFLTLSRPLEEGERLRITLPTEQVVTYVYSSKNPNPLFKVNQVGYSNQAREKYAYIGAWQGTAGAMPIQPYIGKEFRVCRSGTDEVVFKGTVTQRVEDVKNNEGAYFTGEEVGELDISKLNEDGRYYLTVDGLGRSYDFSIGSEGIAESFYIHIRGLYHKRCGIAKEEPYTHWVCPACHDPVVRGTFPPNYNHYSAGKESRPYGFFDESGKSMAVSHFKLISENIPEAGEKLHLVGGWHDAADCDRRPMHLGIVGDLCGVYMLKPGNFIDGQQNIPESGNGIPDILDEARWGLEHLRKGQQADGGVGTWIETTRHPNFRDGLPSEEKLQYYLSCATRESTLEYAAYASMLALAMKRAGALEPSALYRDSAKRAWDYALNPANTKEHTYSYMIEKKKHQITYKENPELPIEFLVKAGFNLSLLYDDLSYQDPADAAIESQWPQMQRSLWTRSPLLWIELEIFFREGIRMESSRQRMRKYQREQAQLVYKTIEKSYPYRTLWHEPTNAWVYAMGWGTYHPFRRALSLLSVYEMDSNKGYLDGMWIAYDFHNGVNPLGRTLTSGLGRVYPVRFLDLTSCADGIDEYVPGITPYGNTYAVPWEDLKVAHGLFYNGNKLESFSGSSIAFLPKYREGVKLEECMPALRELWPIWRRCACLEAFTVPVSEYTVWETISPAAAVTGYLMDKPMLPKKEWIERRPAADLRRLPGYMALP